MIRRQTNYSYPSFSSTIYVGYNHAGIINTSMLTLPIQSNNTFNVFNKTKGFNSQFMYKLEGLHAKREMYESQVNRTTPNSRDRNRGVDLAWEYEKADIEMGGKGSANWDKSQRQEILETGRVRGAEGHHQRNVADHPEDQADPDNIKFYKSRKEHRIKGHQGKWSNESNAPKKDKDAMVTHTNRKRVIKNELKGAGIAAVIGFVSGASIGFIVTIAQNGISPDALKDAAINGGKIGVEGAAFGLINHIGTRLVGDVATNAMTGLLSNFGIEITENITKACNMGIAGSIAIITFSVYQFVRLKMNGATTKDALCSVGKNAAISVASLAVTVVVQAAYGGPAALAVSIGIGAVMLSYSMYNFYHDKKLMSRIHCYTIEKSYPCIIE